MAFVTEKEELKPGLIIFRRGDVEHRMAITSSLIALSSASVGVPRPFAN